MIPRYTPTFFHELWSPQTKYATWLRVELAACEAMEEAGLVPSGTTASIAPFGEKLDALRIETIEEATRHDVIAFLTHVEELAGPAARWLHLGMTSSDVVDTAFALLLTQAVDACVRELDKVLAALRTQIEKHRHTPMIGRSHGIHAEPVTFGLVLAGHFAEVVRCRERLQVARREIAVGKISGAVGTYAHLPLDVERSALARLALRPETVATQVVARDRHAALMNALALTAAAVERFATNVRHWQRTEVGEAAEAFGKGQKGSSAMPHKRNPVLSENLCGLARVVRASVVTALENIALWHERDISHSSAERMVFPDATTSVGFMLQRVASVVVGLDVNVERMKRNLELTHGLWASEAILLSLVQRGTPRQEAYVWVQRNALRALTGEGLFRDLLARDAEVAKHLSAETIDECFSLEHALGRVQAVIDRALASANL